MNGQPMPGRESIELGKEIKPTEFEVAPDRLIDPTDVGRLAVENQASSPDHELIAPNEAIDQPVRQVRAAAAKRSTGPDLLDMFGPPKSVTAETDPNDVDRELTAAERIEAVLAQAIEKPRFAWADETIRIRPIFHLDTLNVSQNKASNPEQRKHRQSYALSASNQVLQYNDTHGQPMPGVNPTISSSESSCLTYAQGIAGIRALGNFSQPPPADITLPEVSINKSYDDVLIEAFSELAAQGPIDRSLSARILLGLRESFMDNDGYQQSLDQIQSQLERSTPELLAAVFIAEQSDEATGYTCYDDNGNVLLTLSYQQALVILAETIVIKATVKDADFDQTDQKLLAVGSTLNAAGIYLSNWRDEDKIDGAGLCELPSTDPDVEHKQQKDTMVAKQHGVISELVARQNELTGEWELHADQDDCPPCAEKADTMLQNNFVPITIEALQPQAELPEGVEQELPPELYAQHLSNGLLYQLNHSEPVTEVLTASTTETPADSEATSARGFSYIGIDVSPSATKLLAKPPAAFSAHVATRTVKETSSSLPLAQFQSHQYSYPATLTNTRSAEDHTERFVGTTQELVLPQTFTPTQSDRPAAIRQRSIFNQLPNETFGSSAINITAVEQASSQRTEEIEIGSTIRRAFETIRPTRRRVQVYRQNVAVGGSQGHPMIQPTPTPLPTLPSFNGAAGTSAQTDTGSHQSQSDEDTVVGVLDAAFQSRTTPTEQAEIKTKTAQNNTQSQQPANKTGTVRTATQTVRARIVSSASGTVEDQADSVTSVDLSDVTDVTPARASVITPSVTVPMATALDDNTQPTGKRIKRSSQRDNQQQHSATLSLSIIDPRMVDTTQPQDVKNRLLLFLRNQSSLQAA
jgi:hypothetical protein